MRRRLLLSYLSLTLFALLALALPLGMSFAGAEQRRATSKLRNDAYALALRAGSPWAATSGRDSDASLEGLLTDFRRSTGSAVVVVDADGDLVAGVGTYGRRAGAQGLGRRPEVAAALHGQQAVVERSGRHGRTLDAGAPIVVDGNVVGAVQVTMPLTEVDARIRDNWLLLGVLGASIALVALLAGTLLARSFTAPIAALHEGAARLGEGDLSARVPVPDDPPELRGLAESFNVTAARLQTLVRSQQAFVADASHQLRTPLAALRLRLENVEAEAPAFRADDLEGALTEVGRLSGLVDGLLALARTEHAESAVTEVDLTDVVEGRRRAWAALAAERGVDVVADVEPASVCSTPGRLEQVFDNLLNNALDAAPTGSEVRIVGTVTGDEVRVEVRDEGPGMGTEERARAFDRFWRASRRSREQGGFGLGLAIVRQLVVGDGGSVELADGPEGGLAVVLRLRSAHAVSARSAASSSPEGG